MADAAAGPDRDLASIQEARALARLATQAQRQLAEYSQEQIDALVDAMAAAATERRKPATASGPTKFRRMCFRRRKSTGSFGR